MRIFEGRQHLYKRICIVSFYITTLYKVFEYKTIHIIEKCDYVLYNHIGPVSGVQLFIVRNDRNMLKYLMANHPVFKINESNILHMQFAGCFNMLLLF